MFVPRELEAFNSHKKQAIVAMDNFLSWSKRHGEELLIMTKSRYTNADIKTTLTPAEQSPRWHCHSQLPAHTG